MQASFVKRVLFSSDTAALAKKKKITAAAIIAGNRSFTQAHFTLSTILHNQYIVSHFVIILVNSELHC